MESLFHRSREVVISVIYGYFIKKRMTLRSSGLMAAAPHLLQPILSMMGRQWKDLPAMGPVAAKVMAKTYHCVQSSKMATWPPLSTPTMALFIDDSFYGDDDIENL
ncbi:uncharacterized protein LOC132198445 [Neocloeon triangulifer]|uniref:uncharacterized protein LOC132198445 n=1 Tax=Neocloeon triangulifer TaxID=2078957 RepID=UPI00286ED91F|nr:uncharacterized protein LOC132198445 [Neocloeon triangulifer]